jgi:uncharacterized membrane protein
MKIPSEATLRRSIAFFATLGIGVATYITIVESGGGAPACLAGGGGCHTVAASSYSHIAGINIAIFGILGYVGIFLTAFFVTDLSRLAGFGFALGGFGFSIYLTYLEIWVIDAICQWCVGSAVLMTILFLLNAARLIGYAGTTPGPDVEMTEDPASGKAETGAEPA